MNADVGGEAPGFNHQARKKAQASKQQIQNPRFKIESASIRGSHYAEGSSLVQ